MKQGEIWYANLNPSKGSEQAGLRPVAVISGNMLNQYMPIVIVVPLTTKIKNYKGNPILDPDNVNGLKQRSEILTFHIRSISKDRLIEKVGRIEKSTLTQILKTIHDILTY
jgi:mRNA interferase MazF